MVNGLYGAARLIRRRLVPAEFFLFYALALVVLAVVVVLMALAWIVRVDRKPS
ncbi:hypothetical protein [Sinorhizobium psoraleae]|nr:hypothetical protein [Sinorhizobium psoraleae]